jgi:perosamine synthetase
VIVPEITWIASAAPVSYVGALPVFADVDPSTWCLTADSFERCVTGRTRAVIPVDLYGGMPDMDSIREVARRHGITVIEDAAEAMGAQYKGRWAGSLGDIGVFSFHGSKTLTTGEGGMLVTGSDTIRDRVLTLRDHGRRPGDTAFWNTEVAFKYKMSGLQAALGLAQLERLEELVGQKRRIFSWYEHRLGNCAGLRLNDEAADTRNSYWMVTVIVGPPFGERRDELIEKLAQRQIDTRPFFNPLSSLPAFRATPGIERARADNRTAYHLSPRGINLPSALSLTLSQVDHVCGVLLELLGQNEHHS